MELIIYSLQWRPLAVNNIFIILWLTCARARAVKGGPLLAALRGSHGHTLGRQAAWYFGSLSLVLLPD